MKLGTTEPMEKEFDRQIRNLLQKGYAGLAGLGRDEFAGHIGKL